jgi:aldehyde dehydrogenase (NAD+)
MGSKSAVVVFNDANIQTAINASVASAFKLSGQRCVSASRILIQKEIYEFFCQQFTTATQKLKVGEPYYHPSSINCAGQADFGPVINQSQLERILRFNEMTKGKANIFLQGQRLDQKGYFLSPHVYGCEWDNHPFLKQEVFGPHVALIPFTDIEDAIRIYNDTDYGLSLAVHTQNMSTARYMRDNCDFGLGYHNLPGIGAESHLNFGGVKKSGYGGSSAAGTFRTVTNDVTWTTNFDQTGFQFCQGMK